MRNEEVCDKAQQTLDDFWDKPQESGSHAVPLEIVSSISTVIGSRLVAARYALPTQLLLKIVTGSSDSRKLTQFEGVEGNLSARSFAKRTTARPGSAISRRLGNSDDPYVSNPLRRARLDDHMAEGKHGTIWASLFGILALADAEPQLADDLLRTTLQQIRLLPEVEVKETNPTELSALPDLSSLISETQLSEDLLLDILAALESDQPQIILAGPPGTSKTYAARAIAAYVTANKTEMVSVVQFHASYGYEDFIEGLRPNASNGLLTFDVRPGTVRRLSGACDDDGEQRVLIMDELNRANLPRVLGELLYALERRGESVELLFTEEFKLTRLLAFIGTMNTADRSIRSIDAAVRRRFQIFEFSPSSEILSGFYGSRSNEVPELVAGFLSLNGKLTTLLDKHHTIGHTFFMVKDGMTVGRLEQIWIRQVFPLLEEYLFNMPDELNNFSIAGFWPSVEG